MNDLIDMRSFASRLRLRGQLILETGLRVSAGRDITAEATNLPVLKDVFGQPYIPGASFKGVWRAYTESMLQAIQTRFCVRGLACISVPRSERPSADSEGCLTISKVNAMKADPHYNGQAAQLDADLRAQSCLTCRVFGAPWLASKVLVKDLVIDPTTYYRPELRDGVAIDRDTAHVSKRRKYDYEIVPANAEFALEVVVENAMPEELGTVWVGLAAFESGHIQLGGGRSRGSGWCHVEFDWATCEYVEGRENLLDVLFPGKEARPVESEANWSGRQETWIAALETFIEKKKEAARDFQQ